MREPPPVAEQPPKPTAEADADPLDRVSLLALVCGGTLAILSWRDLRSLLTGLALGLGGVALSLRRRVARPAPAATAIASPPAPSPRPSPLLASLLALAVLAAIARVVVQVAASLDIGQQLAFSTGHSLAALAPARAWLGVERALQLLALVAALGFLAAALRAWQRR